MGDSLPLQHGCGRRQKQILGHNRDVVARFVQSLSDNCEVLCPPGTSDLPRVFFLRAKRADRFECHTKKSRALATVPVGRNHCQRPSGGNFKSAR